MYMPLEELSYWQSYGITSFMYLFWLVLNFLLIVVIYNSINSSTDLIRVIKVLIISSGLFSIYGIYQFIIVTLLGESAHKFIYSANYEYLREGYIRLLSF